MIYKSLCVVIDFGYLKSWLLRQRAECIMGKNRLLAETLVGLPFGRKGGKYDHASRQCCPKLEVFDALAGISLGK